jgi:hypothetical protein
MAHKTVTDLISELENSMDMARMQIISLFAVLNSKIEAIKALSTKADEHKEPKPTIRHDNKTSIGSMFSSSSGGGLPRPKPQQRKINSLTKALEDLDFTDMNDLL